MIANTQLRCLTVVALGAGLLACGGSRAGSGQAETLGTPLTPEHRGYLLLADGSVHLTTEGEPAGLYVGGVIEGGRFAPEGDVLGEGPMEQGGAVGWLELLDQSFYAAQSGRAPVPPYVEGAMTAEGLFRPSTRRVAY